MNQATAQLNSLFRSMTLGARITAGLLLVVIVVSLAYLFNGRVSGPDSYLMGAEPISGPELNAMQAAHFDGGRKREDIKTATRIEIPRPVTGFLDLRIIARRQNPEIVDIVDIDFLIRVAEHLNPTRPICVDVEQ